MGDSREIGNPGGAAEIHGHGASATPVLTTYINHKAIMIGRERMRRKFAVRVWKEGDLHIAQALDIDVASQGESHEEALANLREALELYFEPPFATANRQIPTIEVLEVDIAAVY